MINIATPIILQQANGSFAESTNEIDLHKIAASYFETIQSNSSYNSSGKIDSQKEIAHVNPLK